MGISKIGRLFAANFDIVSPTQPAAPSASRADAQQSALQSSAEAVVLSKSLQSINRTPLSEVEETRAARVQQLKEQVRSGEYKVNREAVAVSIVRDLA